MASKTRWFFDTEFIDTGKTIDLISIGIVGEDGRRSYSACLEDRWEDKLPPWQIEHVLPRLPPPELRKPSHTVAREIVQLVEEDQPEFWAYHASYDWVALCQLVTGGGRMIDLPKSWPHFVCDLKMLMRFLGVGKESLPARPEDSKHDALEDARWARDTYLYLREKKSLLTTDKGKRDEIPRVPVKCRRCRSVKIVPGDGSVGNMMKASGYAPILLSDASILWLCPKCAIILRPHIQEIVDATGGDHVHWPDMINLLKDSDRWKIP